MAGVLWGENVWAIYEEGGRGHVVKPGDSVGEYEVVSITPEAVLVRDPQGHVLKVTLQGRGAASGLVVTPTQPTLPGQEPSGEAMPGLEEEGGEGEMPALPGVEG